MTWDPEAPELEPTYSVSARAEAVALAREDDERRFRDLTDVDGPFPESLSPDWGNCWLWLGRKNKQGYGQFWRRGYRGGCQQSANIAAWELTIGPLPGGNMVSVRQKCGNPSCVRDTHLFLDPASGQLTLDQKANIKP